MTLIRITPETTRAELAEAITWAAQAAARIPEHHTEQKARAHERIDAMLDDWEARPA